LPSRKFDLRAFTVNHHARRVVTNKLKRNHNPLKLARCRWDLLRDGIQSFPGRSPWAWCVLSFGDGTGGDGTPHLDSEQFRLAPGMRRPRCGRLEETERTGRSAG